MPAEERHVVTATNYSVEMGKKKGGEKNGIKPQKGSKPMDPIRTISK